MRQESDETDVDISSIVPSEKTFDTELFLTLVHGNITMADLKDGLENLIFSIQQKSAQRESLVREHFGLFVKCTEALEWLKGSRY